MNNRHSFLLIFITFFPLCKVDTESRGRDEKKKRNESKDFQSFHIVDGESYAILLKFIFVTFINSTDENVKNVNYPVKEN